MKLKILLAAVTTMSLWSTIGHSQSIQQIDDYNSLLPNWGASWSAGNKSTNGYYPSFYTGFAMRSEYPEKIHIHVSRGNQVRVSVILDQNTIMDYLFDLVKRGQFYNYMTASTKKLDINPGGSKFLPQLSFYQQIISSPQYNIQQFVGMSQTAPMSDEALYSKGLETLKRLNPGRVFMIQLDLNKEFAKWKQEIQIKAQGDSSNILSNPNNVVWALNTLVWGRINYITAPTPEVLAQLSQVIDLAVHETSENEFQTAALNLFKILTGQKYQIQVLTKNGQFEKALQCDSSGHCFLNYPEFTTIYPTGSVEAKTRDEFGNVINQFATPGLWNFINYSGREVDNIRSEPYYGFIPKMDFEGIGNGFHNPAVRFFDPSTNLKKALNIDLKHNTLWAVKRGGVSHGCLRLPAGHVWELRQILPVENAKMNQVSFFGNNSEDFDLYDINGDGTPEVMGVQYLISYGLKGADDIARREGTNFEINDTKKLEFYNNLYGSRNIFEVQTQEQGQDHYVFINPKVSVHSHLDLKKKRVSTRMTMNGRYSLYEQKYEKEKLQFYGLNGSIDGTNKLLVRLMGRVRGCAPRSDKYTCGEAAFNQEVTGLVR
jgi:hypothetical protein